MTFRQRGNKTPFGRSLPLFQRCTMSGTPTHTYINHHYERLDCFSRWTRGDSGEKKTFDRLAIASGIVCAWVISSHPFGIILRLYKMNVHAKAAARRKTHRSDIINVRNVCCCGAGAIGSAISSTNCCVLSTGHIHASIQLPTSQ